MRTLLRDSEFGEVAGQAGTTRHVANDVGIKLDNILHIETKGSEHE